MNYGYFDDENREYVITRPDTPTPWINYLGQGGYSGIISNTAGGTSFDKDPHYRRVIRYKFNNLPIDRSGRYLYIRDMESGEYWSSTWQPVLKDLDLYECRHGMGYTKIKGVYKDIEAETLYFVPVGKSYEVWHFKIKNNSNEKRELQVFSYLEFAFPNTLHDLNGDWTRMKNHGEFKDNVVIIDTFTQFRDSNPSCAEPLLYFATNAEVEGYDLSLEKFIGPYRSETNPIAVVNGKCSNSDIYSDYAVGGLCCPITLMPGEEKELCFVLGASDIKDTIVDEAKKALDANVIHKDFQDLKKYWEEYLSTFKIITPDKETNRFLNIWNKYQCKMTFDWSRYISFYERGLDRGFGFRDSMQDPLGILFTAPDQAKERMKMLLKIQKQRGDALSVYYPYSDKAEGGGRSDDHLWSIFSVCSYIKETGDLGFLDEMLPYHDGGEGTVLEHIENAVKFTLNMNGPHGIPLLLKNDWNDSLSPIADMGGSVESVFVFFQLGHGIKELIALYEYVGNDEKKQWAQTVYQELKSKLEVLWDGKWFLRAFDKYGRKFGTSEDECNRIFLNPQSWAVLSGLPTEEMMIKSFDSVREYLKTDYGLMLNYPAPNCFDFEKKYYIGFPAGARENGGIFYHSNPWAIMAETILGRNDYAFEYYKAMLPSKRNDVVDVTRVEPYVYCQNMLSSQHPRYGACYNSWLSGTAAWVFFAATQYILGIRPDFDGLLIDPCLPSEWNEVKIEREFRGVLMKITIKNTNKGAKGTGKLLVDGKSIEGNKILVNDIKDKTEVEIAILL